SHCPSFAWLYTATTCPFFSADTATTQISPLSLHDALPIYPPLRGATRGDPGSRHRTGPAGPRAVGTHRGLRCRTRSARGARQRLDRKSTRLNSSHVKISYAVFCLKKKIRK